MRPPQPAYTGHPRYFEMECDPMMSHIQALLERYENQDYCKKKKKNSILTRRIKIYLIRRTRIVFVFTVPERYRLNNRNNDNNTHV